MFHDHGTGFIPISVTSAVFHAGVTYHEGLKITPGPGRRYIKTCRLHRSGAEL